MQSRAGLLVRHSLLDFSIGSFPSCCFSGICIFQIRHREFPFLRFFINALLTLLKAFLNLLTKFLNSFLQACYPAIYPFFGINGLGIPFRIGYRRGIIRCKRRPSHRDNTEKYGQSRSGLCHFLPSHGPASVFGLAFGQFGNHHVHAPCFVPDYFINPVHKATPLFLSFPVFFIFMHSLVGFPCALLVSPTLLVYQNP